jgi:hypothetical protein
LFAEHAICPGEDGVEAEASVARLGGQLVGHARRLPPAPGVAPEAGNVVGKRLFSLATADEKRGACRRGTRG